MFSRRGFFGIAAGAAAAMAAAPAAAVPTADNAVFADIAAMVEQLGQTTQGPFTVVVSHAKYERMIEIFRDIRGQELPPWPYVRVAADLPVIGHAAMPKNTPAQERRERKLRKLCNDTDPPKDETDEQYIRRLSLPCPGRLE